MTEKQKLRNALCDIENRARRQSRSNIDFHTRQLASDVARLVQIIRQEIVR